MLEFADKNIKTVITTFQIFQKVSRQKQTDSNGLETEM